MIKDHDLRSFKIIQKMPHSYNKIWIHAIWSTKKRLLIYYTPSTHIKIHAATGLISL